MESGEGVRVVRGWVVRRREWWGGESGGEVRVARSWVVRVVRGDFSEAVRVREWWVMKSADVWLTQLCLTSTQLWLSQLWLTQLWHTQLWLTQLWFTQLWLTHLWRTELWLTQLWLTAITHTALHASVLNFLSYRLHLFLSWATPRPLHHGGERSPFSPSFSILSVLRQLTAPLCHLHCPLYSLTAPSTAGGVARQL